MKKMILLLLLVSNYIYAQDSPRCKDAEPTYINRMPGFYISECKNSDFSEKEFIYYVNGKALKLKKSGKYYNIWYRKQAGEEQKFSAAQIKQNYLNAVVKVKGKSLADNNSLLTASINGKEVFIELHTTNGNDIASYHIDIIEVESMKQAISINLAEEIDRDGKVALYGILFDTGKSDIKPESGETLAKITEYLASNPGVKIIVVGHTDNTGSYSGNMTLSKARAESIKSYLVTTGKIAPERMIAEGVGQVCPVSTNATEEGRTLNRRVEIVKQ